MSSGRMSESTSHTYRRDIDGLRGLAVLLVVLFHATGSVRGGFIGVDVFFVISGYLITGILLREMEAQTFSFKDFWERRIRRIVPASVVMAVVTVGLGSLVLLPDDLIGLGRSLIAHAMMISNLYFWNDSGYFAAASDQKPLLHTWSLAVEEQFYLVFPLLCWIIMKWSSRSGRQSSLRQVFLKVFLALMVLSFVVSIVMVRRDPTSAFYLLPSRAWELLLGASLACFPGRWLTAPVKYCQAASILGVIMILGSAFQLRDSMPFPGLLALPSCLGAACLIWAQGSAQPLPAGFWLRTLLESRVLVGLGLISYSLYLWHWPFLAYWEYLDVSFSKTISHVMRLTLVLLALGLAYASWRWIETPFRKRGGLLPRRTFVFTAALATFALIVFFGLTIQKMQGMPKRWPDIAIQYAQAAKQMGVDEQGKANNLDATLRMDPPSFGSLKPEASAHVLVWGDSHAMCISPALEAHCKEKDYRGYLVAYSSTPPLLGFVQPSVNGLSDEGPKWGAAVLEMVRTRKIPHILIVGHWQRYTKGRGVECLNAMKETVRQFTEAGTKVWIMKDVPSHSMIVPRALALHAALPSIFPDPSLVACTEIEHHRANAVMDSFTDQLIQAGAKILDPTSLLLGKGGRYLVVDNGKCLYGDVGHHLSIDGALSLSSLFDPLFPMTIQSGKSQ